MDIIAFLLLLNCVLSGQSEANKLTNCNILPYNFAFIVVAKCWVGLRKRRGRHVPPERIVSADGVVNFDEDII